MINTASDLPPKARKLYDLLLVRDFKTDELKVELATGQYSTEDVSLAGFMYVEDSCFDLERADGTTEEHQPGEVLPGHFSSNMYEALELLLLYGLDPNFIVDKGTDDEMNIMDSLLDVENGYLAADCLALLLEHGGNPNLMVDHEGLLLHCTIRMDMGLGDPRIRLRHDTWVHYWMVLVGFGAKLDDGNECFHPCEGHKACELKNHRDYYYGGINSDRYPHHGPEICFFHKDTNLEIGRC